MSTGADNKGGKPPRLPLDEIFRQWEIIRLFLGKHRLVGNIVGAMYYIKHDDIEELFKELYGDIPEGKPAVSLLGTATRMIREEAEEGESE